MRFLLLLFFILSLGEGQKRNFSNFPCPLNCVCFRKTVRCMQIELTEVPEVSLQTTLLDLRFNKIREIPLGKFKYHKHIKSLLLNNNLLTELRNGLFTGLVQLRHLYLYKNRIKHIEPDVFQGLLNLEHLYLHDNEIEVFEPRTFTNLPVLDRLFLYNNKIQHIPPGSFKGLNRLARLRLDSNALVCDCKMAWLVNLIKEKQIHVAASCKYPQEMYGKSLKGMKMSEMHCHIPEILKGPQDVEVSWGGTALFTCRVEGNPTVVWMKNNEEIPPSDRYQIMEDGSLIIKNSQESDGGIYECMIKSNDGEAKSRPARMVVRPLQNPDQANPDFYANDQPKFIATPQSISTSVGDREIRLDCRAVGNPKPTITWSQNGISLSLSSRRFINSEGTLFIRPVQSDDYGTYRCEATNSYGRISATAEVLINVPPVFTLHPESLNTQIGQNAKLECVAVGTPAPQISWFRNNERLKNGGRVQISQDGTVLEIKNIKASEGGLYVCEARNELGYREASAKVEIETVVQRPPTFIYKPYDIQAVLGSTIELPCKGDGVPTPGLQWRKDGSELLRTGRIRISVNGNLYIVGVALEDAGRYECTAINDHGRATASGYVTIKEEYHPAGLGVGDKLVKIAFAEASQEVDLAINRTIDKLFNHYGGPRSSSELFRIIRFPNAPARELARAAEVYERTLVNIRKHIEKGMYSNNTEEFNYKELLTPEHLDLIAKLSGCMAHRTIRNCTDMCFHSRYRSIDGMCNNLQNPSWGASLTAFRRILKPIYENGFSTPIGWNKEIKYYGFPKPSSRLVSTTLLSTEKITQDVSITHMVMQWGQFLDHDLDHAIPSVSSESWDGIDCKRSCDYAAPCYPINIPPGDRRVKNRRCIDFFRSSSICGSGMTSVFFDSLQHREQINQLTSYIDASQVYGFSDELAQNLRDLSNDHGHLREGPIFANRKPLLPYDGIQGMDCRRNLTESNVNCFLAGDIRANEQIGLLVMHTLWFREHNRITDELRIYNPHWDGEKIYQEARKVVGAAMQHITYTNWLPHIVGPKGMEMLGQYKGYDPTVNPSIANVFATAALRFGHTLINPILHRLDSSFKPIQEGHLPLHKAFFSPWRLVEEGGVDPLLRGLFTIPAKLKKPDENLNSDLTEHLFESGHAVALDLAAMNIHRARDHAIPGYIEFRKFCNMTEVDSFEDLRNEITDPEIRRKLRDLYGHPGNIDVFAGGILEDQVEGGRVGPLFRCLLVEQFRRLRDGDRFWYENPSVFQPEQLVQIKQYTLGQVLCDSGDNITQITNNVFVLPDVQGGFISCSDLPRVDLRFWTECCNDCRFSGQLNTISRINGRRFRRSTDEFSFTNSTLKEKRLEEPSVVESTSEMIHGLVDRVKELEQQVKELTKIIKKYQIL
ncbi:hypothetical protein RN001_010227 [Aquatica leii]|uniref:Ig-like domain-containing protein n=1 Tax=Aquatica leii TaxID=1421715 RepID=A0AAN7P954_9COLE|nr:hypothetical protein RN001_010227 [Aquatica leii]